MNLFCCMNLSFESLMKAVSGFGNKYLSWESWQKWTSNLLEKGITPMFQSKKSEDEENPYARTKTSNDYFASELKNYFLQNKQCNM